MANAAGTDADRVSLHCVHKHNTPFVCLDAQRWVVGEDDLPPTMDGTFFQCCLDQAADALTVVNAGRRSLDNDSRAVRVGEIAS